MTHLALTLTMIFVVYLIGYAMGRKDIINDIKEITKQLESVDENTDDQ